MRKCLFPLLLLSAGCGLNPVYRTTDATPAVESIDQQRYLGLWYEQARLPTSFERDCVRSQAEYGVREDGLISVVNTCVTSSGQTRVARGRARPAGAVGEGKLEVSVFGPIWAPYWILDRADDYSWSIVGEGDGRYLWLLTRAETLTSSERQAFEARIEALGYPPEELVWRGHSDPQR